MASRLPRQAQAQLDAANAALEPATPPTPAPVEPPIEPQIPQPPEPPAVELSLPQPTVQAPATPPTENWEHKYRVLQGMFNQQNNQLKQLSSQVQELARPQAPAPTPAPTAAPRPATDPKDVEAFGLDMVSMVQRICEQVFAGAAPVIEGRFQQIEAQVSQLQQAIQGTSQTVAATAEEMFFERLNQLAPEWQRLNIDPAFLAWSNEPDPIYGAPRLAALTDAQSKGDATRAAAVFKAFLATLPPPAPPAPVPSPTPRSAAGAPPAGPPAAKPLISQKEVADFYTDVRRGVYRGNLPLQQQKEAEYNAALAEGRIV